MRRLVWPKFGASITLMVFLFIFFFIPCFSAPDPRDSVIIESKTVQSGIGSPAIAVRVFITNKDTITAYMFPFVERSISGGAYLVLSYPRNFDGIIHRLTSTLSNYRTINASRYNNASPDTFFFGAFYDPLDTATWEPPNVTRKPILEVKFDTIRSNAGTVELDSAFVPMPSGSNNVIQFVSAARKDVFVNFVKSTITVTLPPPSCGDVNGDGQLTTYDLVQALNCVFYGGSNCSRISTPSDLIRLLNATFREGADPPLPC